VTSRRLLAGVAVGAFVLAALAVSAAIFRPDRAIRVATGFVAHTVCANIFVSGFDPQAVFAETTDRAGIRRLRWVLGYHLDRAGSMRRWQACSAAALHFMTGSAACSCTDRTSPICSRAMSMR
jgi:hypothetical protein